MARRGRRGITFVEILLAVFILAVVILPVASLIFGGVGASEETRSYNTGINVARDIMDKILSPQLPFGAIVPEGGESVDLSYGSTRKQAAFAGGFEEFEKAFSDTGDAAKRIIKRQGTEFETFFFAAPYLDTVTNGLQDPPSPAEELTFCFFRNPYYEKSQADRTSVFVDPLGKPYQSPGVDMGSEEANDPRNPSCMAAWPWADDPDKVPEPKDVAEIWNPRANHEVPLVIYDQAYYKEGTAGAMMKVVVGVRWSAKGRVFKGPGYLKGSREFWLVSLKAKLEGS